MNSFVFYGFLLFLLAVLGGGIWLQIFLSRRESWIPGLVLPVLCFVLSLVVVLGLIAFTVESSVMTTYRQEVLEDGTVIMVETERILIPVERQFTGFGVVYLFVLYNIPTAILLAIYAACRGKRRRRRSLDKMSVQDLE